MQDIIRKIETMFLVGCALAMTLADVLSGEWWRQREYRSFI